MSFEEINLLIKSSPEWMHWLSASLMLGAYAQLCLAYYASFNILPKATKIYFPIAHLIMCIYFFAKLQSGDYATVLDIFIFVYVLYYVNMVIVLKARYFRCFDNVKGFFKYKWYAKTLRKK